MFKVKVKEEQEEEEDDDEGSLSSQSGDHSKPIKRRPAAKAKPKAKATLKATSKPKSFGSKSVPKCLKPRPSAPPMNQSGRSTTYYMSAKVTMSHGRKVFACFWNSPRRTQSTSLSLGPRTEATKRRGCTQCALSLIHI